MKFSMEVLQNIRNIEIVFPPFNVQYLFALKEIYIQRKMSQNYNNTRLKTIKVVKLQ